MTAENVDMTGGETTQAQRMENRDEGSTAMAP
jgi:hypothetical protein